MEAGKSQEKQLIGMIYDVREIADGQINETVPLSFAPILRGVSCTRCLRQGAGIGKTRNS